MSQDSQSASIDAAPAKASKKSKSAGKKPDGEGGRHTRTYRAGLVLPVGRIGKQLSHRSPIARMSNGCSIGTTAVIEYMLGEVLEAADNHRMARKHPHKRLSPEDIVNGISGDGDLKELFDKVVFGGCLRRPPRFLLPQRLEAPRKRAPKQAEPAAVAAQ